MKGLTKENFFNEISDKYPLAHAFFLSWIDEQKEKLNYKILFNSDSNWQDMYGKNARAPKFHDLPFELQFGFIVKFLSIQYAPDLRERLCVSFTQKHMKDSLTEMFMIIERKIKNAKLDR